MTVSTVLERGARQQIAHFLSQALADTYILYIKTQNFHWNIVDSRFYSLHLMLEKQYEELAEGIDELAERIRMLGFKSPGSMHEFLEISSLDEAEGDLSADKMLQQLLEGHDKISSQIRPKIEEASKIGDEGTADLLISHLRFHEKTAWMLRSHFKEKF